MYSYLVILATLFLLVATNPPRQSGVNEGASTSTGITAFQRYEIGSYAESMVRLMFAEDIEGGDLRDMFNNRYHELEAFYNEVVSIITMVENGAHNITDAGIRIRRLKLLK